VSAVPVFEIPRRPVEPVRPADRTRPRRRSLAWPRLTGLALLSLGVYVVSTLTGESMAATAQRELARSDLRARVAASRLSDAKRRLDLATSPDALVGWASARGMVHPSDGWLARLEGGQGR
jgi:hypothetical protein